MQLYNIYIMQSCSRDFIITSAAYMLNRILQDTFCDMHFINNYCDFIYCIPVTKFGCAYYSIHILYKAR